jgi:cytosolic carboxypeptidase protein 5
MKSVISEEFSKGTLEMLIDLHAHANKKGCFVFGEAFSDIDKHAEQLLFPKVLSMNCANFDSKECSYSPCDRQDKEDNGDMSNGSARSSIESMTKLTYCFTLEANFARGVRANKLNPRFDIEEKRTVSQEDDEI